jgi:hypothetical protein
MEETDPFTLMVDRSFERIEHEVKRYGLQRISCMERRLEELEKDLTVFLEDRRNGKSAAERTSTDYATRVFY